MTKREEAKKDFENGMSLKDISEKYGVAYSTVKSWKSRHKWEKEVQPGRKKVAPKKIVENDELTEKQKLFCIYYLRSFNATQSYIKAYESTYESALVSGPRLLGNVRIKAFIKELKKETAEELYVDLVDLLKSDIRQANADVGDFLNWQTNEIKLTEGGVPVFDENNKPITRHITDLFLTDKNQVDTKLIKEVYKGKDGLRVVLKDPEKAKDRLYKYLSEAGLGETDTDNKDGLLNAINKSSKGVFGDGDEIET